MTSENDRTPPDPAIEPTMPRGAAAFLQAEELVRRRPQRWADGQAPLPHELPGAPKVRLTDRRDAVQDLRKLGVPIWMIARIFRHLRAHVGVKSLLDSWPTVKAERDSLQQIAKLAPQLAAALAILTPRSDYSVLSPVIEYIGVEAASIDRIIHTMTAIAAGAETALLSMPSQTRHVARADLVAAVQSIIAPLGHKVSDDPKSKFFKICEEVFLIAGTISNDCADLPNPIGAIRAYQKMFARPSPQQIT